MKIVSILLVALLLIASASAFKIKTNTDTSIFPPGHWIFTGQRPCKFLFLLFLYKPILTLVIDRTQLADNEYTQCLVLAQGSSDAPSAMTQQLCQGLYNDAYNDWLASQ